jgi:hypothetical protein
MNNKFILEFSVITAGLENCGLPSQNGCHSRGGRLGSDGAAWFARTTGHGGRARTAGARHARRAAVELRTGYCRRRHRGPGLAAPA